MHLSAFKNANAIHGTIQNQSDKRYQFAPIMVTIASFPSFKTQHTKWKTAIVCHPATKSSTTMSLIQRGNYRITKSNNTAIMALLTWKTSTKVKKPTMTWFRWRTFLYILDNIPRKFVETTYQPNMRESSWKSMEPLTHAKFKHFESQVLISLPRLEVYWLFPQDSALLSSWNCSIGSLLQPRKC